MPKYLLLFSLLFFAKHFILAQEQPEIVITQGHIDNVKTLAFSPDGHFIATGGDDRSIRIWDRGLRQEFRALYGHKKQVSQVAFSSKGNYLVSIDGLDLIVWAIPSGEIVRRLKVESFSRDFVFLPNSNSEIMVSLDNKKSIYNIETGQEIEKLSFGSSSLAIHPHPKEAVFLFCQVPNEVSVFSRKGEKVKKLESKGFFTEIVISQEGDKVAAFSISTNQLVIWDYNTGAVLNTIATDPTKTISKIIIDPTSKYLWAMGWNAEIRVFDIKTGKLKMLLNENKMSPEDIKKGIVKAGIGFDIRLSSDKKIVGLAATVINSDGQSNQYEDLRGVVLYDAESGKQVGSLKGYFKWINHLSIDPSGRYMATTNFGKNMGVRIWDLKEGEVQRYIRSSGMAGASSDGKRIAFYEYYEKKRPEVNIYEFPSFKQVFSVEINNASTLALNADGTILAAIRVDQNIKNPVESRFYISVWDVKKEKEIKQIDIPNTEVPFFWGFHLSPNGDYVIGETALKIFSWEVATGKKTELQMPESDYRNLLAVAPEQPYAIVSKTKVAYNSAKKQVEAFMHILTFDYRNGELINDFNTQKEGVMLSGDFSADGKYLATGQTGYFTEINFDVILWDFLNKQAICTYKGHNGGVKHVKFEANGKRVFSASEDGFIKIWDVEKCALSASMIGMNQLDYIILSPDNYYKTNKGNNEGIGFRFQENLYTFDQFDLRFNRPDKVMEHLGLSPYTLRVYAKAWEKRVNRMGFTEEMLTGEINLPKIEIVDKQSLPITSYKDKLTIRVKAEDKDVLLEQLKIYVNDVPYPNVKGYPLKGKKANNLDEEFNIPLSNGINLVKVSVLNERGLESVRESFEVKYEASNSKKPDLYLFTIGVSEFEQKERNLKFAKKDASDLVEMFKLNNNYNKVNVQSFYNKEATKENVLKAVNFLKKASIDDHVMIYVSTHGLLDDSLNYYLAMHNTDFSKPAEKGLSYEAIDQMLDGISSRSRLVLIDACHSGEVDKDESITFNVGSGLKIQQNAKSGTTLIRPKTGLRNSFTYMQELFSNMSKGTGATVISAAAGYEFALESEDWNNGVFTFAILEGLQTGKADLNEDKLISISELKSYVSTRVTELTEGKQHPTTRTENNLNDFILYKR